MLHLPHYQFHKKNQTQKHFHFQILIIFDKYDGNGLILTISKQTTYLINILKFKLVRFFLFNIYFIIVCFVRFLFLF